eukprot:Nk52_evm8s2209 gene=Nk52_evmTU8s2209
MRGEKSIIPKIPLQPPKTMHGSEFEHEKQVEAQIKAQICIMEEAKAEAADLLQDSKYEAAVLPGLKALQIAMQIFGENSLELVEPYYILGEATSGSGKFKQATEYLTYAKWIIMKNPDCGDTLKSKLYRHFGILAMQKGEHAEAVRYISNEIFHLAVAYGAESVFTATAYYRLGSVFLSNNEAEKVLALYEKVTEIWFAYLVKLIKKDHVELEEALKGIDGNFEKESANILQHILNIKRQALGEGHRETADVYYILAMFCSTVINDFDKALEYADSASEIYETILGSSHMMFKNVKETQKIIKQKQALSEL